jgi:hypothetical protein
MLLRPNDRPLRVAKVDSVFRRDVLKGRSFRPRAIPVRWLYDSADHLCTAGRHCRTDHQNDHPGRNQFGCGSE